MWLLKLFCVYLIFSVFNTQTNVVGNDEEKIEFDFEILEKSLKKGISEEFEKLTEKMKAQKDECCASLKKALEEQKTSLEKLINEQNKKTDEELKKISEKIDKITDGGLTTKEPPPIDLETSSDNHFNCIKNCGRIKDLPKTCEEAMSTDKHKDGVYLLSGAHYGLKPYFIYCKRIDGKVWAIFQRREDGSEDFYRTWNDYKLGFGSLHNEYWLGLERLHARTTKEKHEMYVYIETQNGTSAFAHYDSVKIDSEDEKFRITVDGYSGSAGDGFTKDGAKGGYNGQKFSTHDNCNDNHGKYQRECAKTYKGAWWFNLCYKSHLNGPYNSPKEIGVDWNPFSKKLKASFMAIRSVEPKALFSPVFHSPQATVDQPNEFPESLPEELAGESE